MEKKKKSKNIINIINASKEDWNEWKMSEAIQVQSLVSQPIHFSLTLSLGRPKPQRKEETKVE